MISSLGVNKRPAGMWVLAALPKNSFVFVMYVEVMQGWKGKPSLHYNITDQLSD